MFALSIKKITAMFLECLEIRILYFQLRHSKQLNRFEDRMGPTPDSFNTTTVPVERELINKFLFMQERNTAQADAISIGSAELV